MLANSIQKEKIAFLRISELKLNKSFKVKLPDPFEEEKKIIDSLESKEFYRIPNNRFWEVEANWKDAIVETWYVRKQVIAIDSREFWSQIPHYIYQAGFWVIPIQLQIGDYILSDSIAIERKSVSSGDFHNSLCSGRLLTQTSKMTKFFKQPILLIEFDESIPFQLKERELKSLCEDDISIASIYTKLFVLVLNFPSLNLLWSETPLNTVQMFKSLKAGWNNPDLDKISKIGKLSNSNKEDDQGESAIDIIQNDSQEEEDLHGANSSYLFLSGLPGVFSDNIERIIWNISSLKDLWAKTENEIEVMIGTNNARKLHSFLHNKISKNN